MFLWAAYAVFAIASVWLSVIDIREHRLPNRGTLALLPALLALFALAAWALGDFAPFWRAVIAAVVLFVIYLILNLVYPAGMGMGDVKLAPSIGVALGWWSWGTVWWGSAFAVLTMGVLSLVLLVTRKASMKTALPFGPFMFLGAWIGIFLTLLNIA